MEDGEVEVTIEKPFKCKSCNATFTNEDHLEVHRRRHEMSLNLGLGNINSNSNQPDGFTDQTPTPTRFFRISEEVGFFQDLQNVNPFDAEFAKASATGTPSSDNHFEFQFTPSIITTTASSSLGNTNDTLNTPQVFGFPPCTPLPGTNQTNTTFIVGKKRTILTPTGTAPNVPNFEDTNSKTDNIDGESESSEESKNNKYKIHQLKLNCSPLPISPGESNNPTSSSPNPNISPKKAELLERNRAAASRSRERRKQWVSALEDKCASLQTVLSQVQSEVNKLRQENSMLKEELGKHGNCDVTRGTYDSKSQIIQPQLSMPKPPPFQPAILRSPSSSSSTRIQISSITSLEQIPGVKIIQFEPDPKLPKPTKRGRPKRGYERRVTNITIPQPTTLSESELTKVPIKVQILPLHRANAEQRK